MQPLQRFTQCGSPTMLFTVFIVLFGVSSTTARHCMNHSDCHAIQGTSCVKDTEKRYRCLCGDNQAPLNGQCSNSKKGLRHLCLDTEQCTFETTCLVENSTTKAASFGPKLSVGATKICLCDEENGYKEDVEHNLCNGAVQILTGLLVPLTSLFFGTLYRWLACM